MEGIEESKKSLYKVTNSFYEINADTMWTCKDTAKSLPYSQNKLSSLRDKPLSAETHMFDE